jgi:hypothetical protein
MRLATQWDFCGSQGGLEFTFAKSIEKKQTCLIAFSMETVKQFSDCWIGQHLAPH